MFLRFGGIEWKSNKGVCRAALATPSLFNILLRIVTVVLAIKMLQIQQIKIDSNVIVTLFYIVLGNNDLSVSREQSIEMLSLKGY